MRWANAGSPGSRDQEEHASVHSVNSWGLSLRPWPWAFLQSYVVPGELPEVATKEAVLVRQSAQLLA